LIDIGYLAGSAPRNAWIHSALSGEPEFRIVLRAREVAELGPRRVPSAVFIWDLGDSGMPDRQTVTGFLDRLPGEPALIVIGEDVRIADWITDYPGTWGWLAEDPNAAQLSAAVRAADAELSTLDAAALELMRTGAGQRPETSRSTSVWSPDALRQDPLSLSPREREILACLASGSTNRQIALDLGISENTVKFHIGGLFEKLGVSSRTEAIGAAVRAGFLAL